MPSARRSRTRRPGLGADRVEAAREVERRLRQAIVDAVQDVAADRQRLGQVDGDSGAARVGLRHVERLGEEPLELAGARAEGAGRGQRLPDARRDRGVLRLDEPVVQQARARGEGIDGRLDPDLP